MYRIGLGHDTHRFKPASNVESVETLRLGGVDIPFGRALLGHSDADVLLHAIADALLGAAALGDIGEHFPDTEEENRGKDSGVMLAHVAERVRNAGYGIVNIDSIIFAEAPNLKLVKPAMRQRIAEILALPIDRVAVKAKTGERIGIIGRGEAISAEAVTLIAPMDEID